jgi:FAD/FMN-containing dehydrogenase
VARFSQHDIVAPNDFRGELITEESKEYELARGIINTRLSGQPAVIARCAGIADVRAALRIARDNGLEISIRSGGHHVAGWASNTGGMVIDLSLMRWVHVNAGTSTAWAGGGTRAMDAIIETAEFGLVPVTGTAPTIGITGLLTGLGEGYLTPRHGFGVDNVLAFDLVTADNRVLRVSADQQPELFWAMRGAGPNFGIVTAIKLRLHPLPKQAIGGWLTFNSDDARNVTQHIWDVMKNGSEHFFPLTMYKHVRPGQMEVHVLPAHTGPTDVAEQEVNALRRCGSPTGDTVRPMSYVDLVKQIDLAHTRAMWDMYRFEFDGPAQEQANFLLEQAGQVPPSSYITIWRTNSTPVPPSPGAAPRLPGVTVCIENYWQDPAEDGERVRWLTETSRAFQASGLVTEAANAMNHVSVLDPERVRALYGKESYQRLETLKAEYDPENIFHRNYNIPPGAGGKR